MIRLTLLWMFIAFLAMYAWKDWYKSLCGLILMMAVIEHPDMPKSLFGIQGLSPWNILLMCIIFAWLAARGKEGGRVNVPVYVKVLLGAYFFFIVTSFFRMISDTSGLDDYAIVLGGEKGPTIKSMTSEYLINCFKWVVPGFMLFDGCRSRSRFTWGICSLLGVYFLLAIQIIKWMPLSIIASGVDLTGRSGKILLKEVGYHRVNLSQMMAGASWAFFAMKDFVSPVWKKYFVAMSLMLFFALALTGGRTGYGTWAIVGFVLCSIKWRKYLLVAPLLVVIVFSVVPGAKERMLQGFTEDSVDSNSRIEEIYTPDEEGGDLYTITAGRNLAWPFVIEKIKEAPWIGHGRLAMQSTGISSYLYVTFKEKFPHPHNAYLQFILDNGFLGFIPVLLFYIVIVHHSVALFRDSRRPLLNAVGGVSLALVLALLVASMGSQTFYPREGAVPMWCAIALLLRVYLQPEVFFEETPSGIAAPLDKLPGK